ncbi:hypothetical protein PDJAM_G00173680, partial [Pangasius djambal]|nr:hypothetical protein [Pangasius djambal]
ERERERGRAITELLHCFRAHSCPHSGALRPPLALAERRAELRAPASLPCIFRSDCAEQCAGARGGNCSTSSLFIVSIQATDWTHQTQQCGAASGLSLEMASAEESSSSRPDHHEATECSSGAAFQEAQKWIEAVTGRTFGEKDFRSSLENGILLCELLSSIKPGLVKKINRLPTPIAGLDNLTMFLRGCEELGLKGSQLFDPGDLQDMSIRANLTGSDCSRKLKNVLITIYWLGKTANSCASYSGPTLDLKEFEGLLSMMRKECVNEEPDSPKRSVRDSGCVDNWESEHSDSLSPPRHRREDSFDSLDSFSSQSQPTPSPDTVLRANSDDLEGDHRKLPDVLKDDMSARRVSYKEPRAALPFNQYLPNKSNQSTYVPAQLRKRRSEREEERRSGSNSTSPIREECVGISSEQPLALNSQKTVTWAVVGGAEPQLDEAELTKMRKLEKAGIKVLPASARYSSPKVTAVEPDQAKSPSPDIIRRCDNNFLRAEHTHEWDEEDDEDEEGDRKVPDIQKDDLASRRARMNQLKPNVAHQFLPSSCSSKDRERWEGIRLSSQHAVLEMLEKMEHEKKSESDTTSAKVSIVARKDNPFLSPHGRKKGEEEESDEEDKGQSVVPNIQKDDLARRRTQIGSLPQRDPRQSLAQTSITQSDLEKWQRLSMTIDNSEATPVEVSIITRKDNPFLSPEKAREKEDDEHEQRETEGGGQAALPNIQKDDLARRRGQTGALPHRDHQQSLAQTAMTQSDLEKWQRLQMSTENSGGSSNPTSPLKSPQPSISDPKHHLTLAEREALELRLAEKARDEKEYEEEEEEEEKERQPDLKKDDMMARRTGVFQKASGNVYRFLPLPGSKKESRPADSVPKESKSVSRDPALDRNIKTKRFKVGQRVEQVKPEPTVPSSAAQKEPEVLGSTGSTHAEVHCDSYNYPDNDDEYNDGSPLPNLEKDDMLARKTGSYQKLSGNQFNAFLPKPGGVKGKNKSASGQYQSNLKTSGQERKDTQERSVTPPPADVDDMPRKCPQILDGQKADTVGMMGGEIDVVGGAQAQSPLPLPVPDARHTFCLDDDVPPLTFSHKASSVSDETESISLIDMRDEEEDVDSLSPHSQTRHERLHNQYNKLKEEEDQWQDDLARWKNRRRSASQDLIRKEEERKMMEKLMTSEGSSHRRKSIKTYKEIVEEKERREQELHELYCQASTPEEKAAILQRYALRFTISDAILEKLQLPKLPSVAKLQSAYILNEEAEISESQTFTETETDSSDQYLKQITHTIMQSHLNTRDLSPVQDSRTPEAPLYPKIPLSPARDPKTPEVQLSPVRDSKTPEVQLSPVRDSKTPEVQLSPVRDSKTPEVQLSPVRDSNTPDISLSLSLDSKTLEAPLSPIKPTKTPEVRLSPVRIPPAPSRPVPLLTPKPYSQPKFNQPSFKQVKNDGLVRVNGDAIVEDTRESPVRPVSFTPTPPKPASQSPQRVSAISAGSETTAQECTQTLTIQKTEHVKEENDSHSSPVKKDETSETLADSELTGEQTVPDTAVKCNCVVKTTIVTELRETHSLPTADASIAEQMSCSDGLGQKSDEISFTESGKADVTSYSEGFDFTSECIETPILNLAKRVNHWTWDPNEERKRQERWQQEQERLLQEKYQREQERLKQEWEKAQKEVEEEERKHHEEEQRILEETVTPLTPHSSCGVTETPPTSTTPHDTIVLSLADWERKQEMLEKEAKMNQRNGLEHRSDAQTEAVSPPQQNDQRAELQESQSATPQLQFTQDGSWSCKSESRQEWKKTASLDRNVSPSQSQPPRMRRSGSYENILGIHTSPSSQDTSPSSSDRSVSAKKLCSSCAQPLGKGAAMIIDALGLYFHIQCFKCGVCKGLLGDMSTGTDVRIRNGVLNCHSCYMKSRAAGQPTTL